MEVLNWLVTQIFGEVWLFESSPTDRFVSLTGFFKCSLSMVERWEWRASNAKGPIRLPKWRWKWVRHYYWAIWNSYILLYNCIRRVSKKSSFGQEYNTECKTCCLWLCCVTLGNIIVHNFAGIKNSHDQVQFCRLDA